MQIAGGRAARNRRRPKPQSLQPTSPAMVTARSATAHGTACSEGRDMQKPPHGFAGQFAVHVQGGRRPRTLTSLPSEVIKQGPVHEVRRDLSVLHQVPPWPVPQEVLRVLFSGSLVAIALLLVSRLLRGEWQERGHAGAAHEAVEVASVPELGAVQRAGLGHAQAVPQRIRDALAVQEVEVAAAVRLGWIFLERRALGHEDLDLLAHGKLFGDPNVMLPVLVHEGDHPVLSHALWNYHQDLLLKLALLQLMQVRVGARHALLARSRRVAGLEGVTV
mmetsp:Transcript_7362/g.20382  ORF Transcript_7362/g.20382 Transcript_7362/m.20382 type:complete len:276 (+) Transcript_7362:52-879(+)